jgi:hypothetical protein
MLQIPCTLHTCVTRGHSIDDIIVNLVPYFPSNHILPNDKIKSG